MDRTSSYKRYYVAVLSLALIVTIAAIGYFEIRGSGLLGLILFFVAPGRVGAYLLHDLFRGRSLLDKQLHAQGIAASERFLDALDKQPWRQYFMYFFFGIYTWNSRAMALNNIGAGKMELGQLDDAKASLMQAIELDQAYPIPYWNLAIIAAVQEDHQRSDQMQLKAQQLGYRQDSVDRTINRVAATYARVQSIPI